jgi:glutathione synthase/RimK-type ligase-like ATP-grasp enzyme
MKAAYGIDIHLSEFGLGDTRISLDDVVSVWYRRTEAINLPANIKGEDRRFARAECQSFIKGLWHATAHRNWVSFPDAIRGASDKAEQLWRARRHGFNVPKTLFSNDAAAVRSFCDEVGGTGKVVYKPHNSIMFSSGSGMEVVYTVALNTETYARLDEIHYCPGIFQEKLEKHSDIRVTIFGKQLFAVAIHSQADSETQTDWRAYPWSGTELPLHEPVSLPSSLQKRCLEYLSSYHLKFGAIDLVRTLKDDYVFLELNPNGQWAWIESETGLAMSDALVNLLEGEPSNV